MSQLRGKKLVLLAPANVMHTVRWANAMSERGLEVHVISCHPKDPALHKNIIVHKLRVPAPLGYFLNQRQTQRLLDAIRPDLINAHFASGYGTLGRAVKGKYPYLLSVWGNDVYEFPLRSSWHKKFLRKNLLEATELASTSHAMARVTEQTTTERVIHITPFGIDEKQFSPSSEPSTSEATLVVGTVKTLKPKYGIDTLIRAFAQVVKSWHGEQKLKLVIAGGGPQLAELQKLAQEFQVSDSIAFLGQIAHADVPNVLNQLDIYVALSRYDSESFGVAILEASACELPVVVTDTDGPAEVTEHERTGLIVPRENPEAAAQAILTLLNNEQLRQKMGKQGRQHVLDHYTWQHSVDIMLDAYEQTIKAFHA